MKRSRFTEEQIIGVLKEAGAKMADLERKHGVSEAMLYNLKAKYDGLEVSEAKRLRALEDGAANSAAGSTWPICIGFDTFQPAFRNISKSDVIFFCHCNGLFPRFGALIRS